MEPTPLSVTRQNQHQASQGKGDRINVSFLLVQLPCYALSSFIAYGGWNKSVTPTSFYLTFLCFFSCCHFCSVRQVAAQPARGLLWEKVYKEWTVPLGRFQTRLLYKCLWAAKAGIQCEQRKGLPSAWSAVPGWHFKLPLRGAYFCMLIRKGGVSIQSCYCFAS